jgi:hypothetical protein
MEQLIRAIGRAPLQRTTLYQPASEERHLTALQPAPLTALINSSAANRSLSVA